MTYDLLSTLMSPVDVGASLAGLEHRDVPLSPIIGGWERAEKRRTRLLSCVGMSKLYEWFLLFLATMASNHAEDRPLAKDTGEVRMFTFEREAAFIGGHPVRRTSPLTLLQRRYGRLR